MNAFPQPPLPMPGPRRVPVPVKRRSARWKRIVGWGVGCLTALVLLLVVGLYMLLHNSRFHAYVLREAQAKASQALASPVQVRDFSFVWSGQGPTLEIYDLLVFGNAVRPGLAPLFRADALRLQVTISSLWHRTWYINDVRIERPVVNLLVDSQGRTNLPKPPNQNSNSEKTVDVFELGVRHFSLDRGEIYYNDQESKLSADLRDLAFQLGFAPFKKEYSGVLSYRQGHVQMQDEGPLPHELDARFTVTPAQATLENATLKMGNSRVLLKAIVSDYAQPKVHATYDAVVDGGEFRQVLKNSSLPRGLVYLSGVADYQNGPGRGLLTSVDVHGELHSPEITVTQQNVVLGVRSIGGEYALNEGNLTVRDIHAQLLGGGLQGSMQMRNLAGATRSNMNVSLKDVSVSDIQKLMGPAATQRATLQGSINVSADAAWGKTLDTLVANAEATIAANAKPALGDSSMPLNGLVHGRYDASRQTLALRQSYIKTAQTTVTLDGTVSDKSSLRVAIDARQLHELEELAQAFGASPAAPLNLSGTATVTATVSGAVKGPQVRGQLSANNLRLRDTSWKLLSTQFTVQPSSARLDGGELVQADKGKINFQFSTDLHEWALTPTSALQAHLTATDLSIAPLVRAAGSTTAVSGTLSSNIQVSGSQLAPTGEGNVRLANVLIAGEPVKETTAVFNADGHSVTAKVKTELPAGTATADVRYAPKEQAYEGALHAAGIKLDQLETIKVRGLQVAGVLNIMVSGRGTLQDPGFEATIEAPSLSVQNQTANNLKLTASVANHVARFDLGSQFLGIQADGHGTIRLIGDFPADLKFDTQAIPLQSLIAVAAPAQADGLKGQTELHATVHGPLKDKSKLVAHVEIPQLNLNYKDTVQLAAAGPIVADYTNGTLDVKRSTIKGTKTELTFQGSLPAAKDVPGSLLLQGTVDLSLASLFSPDITSGGQLRFDIDSYGRRSSPDVQGQVHIVNASFTQAGTPLGLSNGNGVLTLTRNRLEITQFQGKAGGGTVTASGGIVYRPDLRFDLAMKAAGVRVLYAQSVRTSLNSDLALTGQYDNAMLRGQVNIDQLSFTSNFDLMDMAGQFGGGVAPPPPAGGFANNLRLDITVHTPQGISPSSRAISIAGTADLQVRGSASQPVLLGRINLSDGELIFRGNRYLVQAGTVEFRNPSRTEPVLDVMASTTIDQYDVQMHFWGPTDHLQTNYTSDPSLPPADIINLIAFGKTSEASAANPTPGGSFGAESLVASQASSQVTNRLEKLAGISQLSIDPVLGGSQQSPGARIAIQQRVTSKIFVTYATDLTSTQQQGVKLEYQFNRRTSMNVVRDQNGGFSFQTTFRKQW